VVDLLFILDRHPGPRIEIRMAAICRRLGIRSWAVCPATLHDQVIIRRAREDAKQIVVASPGQVRLAYLLRGQGIDTYALGGATPKSVMKTKPGEPLVPIFPVCPRWGGCGDRGITEAEIRRREKW
jgi:hypothetical protein